MIHSTGSHGWASYRCSIGNSYAAQLRDQSTPHHHSRYQAALRVFSDLEIGRASCLRVVRYADTMMETGTNYAGSGFDTTVQPSIEACSQRCRDWFNNSCNVFTFCGQPEGCSGGFTTFPFGTCGLKQQVKLPPYLHQPITLLSSAHMDAGIMEPPFTLHDLFDLGNLRLPHALS